MQNNEISLNENLIIYTHTTINLNFFNPTVEHLCPLNMVQKPLSALAYSQTDKIVIIIVDDLAELTTIPIGCEHSIVITAKNNLSSLPEHLSDAIIYQQTSSENHQQALEKVFHALIKTYFSPELFLEPADLYQSDAFEKGQHRINIHSLQEQQLMNENVRPLFSPIEKDNTVILNFNLHQASFSLDKIQDLTEIIIEYLGEKFDGEIFYSCNTTSEAEQPNLIYLSYLSV
ncbi:hypothetical protein QSV37_06965 [Acinetobacter sp. VNK23]|uniref:Uncharacterized protein n=1 Tax=Acinetobacter corruptisaponis TaxID=3045147 RepID=A0ABY8S6X4_9GAMM|nr:MULTISPECIES: hypothetical protein [Acinetobacter]MDM1020047.1 hypothetical protein [Acinetobacter thutiue]WHP06694.1 hypothetical protein QLH32_04265 [Acinetobacter sp. KCTC 92772]